MWECWVPKPSSCEKIQWNTPLKGEQGQVTVPENRACKSPQIRHPVTICKFTSNAHINNCNINVLQLFICCIIYFCVCLLTSCLTIFPTQKLFAFSASCWSKSRIVENKTTLSYVLRLWAILALHAYVELFLSFSLALFLGPKTHTIIHNTVT